MFRKKKKKTKMMYRYDLVVQFKGEEKTYIKVHEDFDEDCGEMPLVLEDLMDWFTEYDGYYKFNYSDRSFCVSQGEIQYMAVIKSEIEVEE